jgi:hypothetical protein
VGGGLQCESGFAMWVGICNPDQQSSTGIKFVGFAMWVGICHPDQRSSTEIKFLGFAIPITSHQLKSGWVWIYNPDRQNQLFTQ